MLPTMWMIVQGLCPDAPAVTSLEQGELVMSVDDGLWSLRTGASPTSVQRRDGRGERAGAPRRWPATVRGTDAVRAGPVVLVWSDALRAYDAQTGALRWSAQLPGQGEADRDVAAALDLQHEEIGVLWQREFRIDPARPGYHYFTVQFARLGLDGRWLTSARDVTPRDPAQGASLGYATPMHQLSWRDGAYRFAYWSYDASDPSTGAVRLGTLTREGALTSRVVSRERADVLSMAEGPTGVAVAWNTVIDGHPAVRVALPDAAPTTLDPTGSSPRIVWSRGAWNVAWDHADLTHSPRTSPQGARLARLAPGGAVVATWVFPTRLEPPMWSAALDLYVTGCGVVLRGYTAGAQTSSPWLWFVP